MGVGARSLLGGEDNDKKRTYTAKRVVVAMGTGDAKQFKYNNKDEPNPYTVRDPNPDPEPEREPHPSYCSPIPALELYGIN